MSELGKIAREIGKKKRLEINLPKYINTMFTLYYRYAYIRLALDYYTFGEMLSQEEKAPEAVKGLAKRLNTVLREQIVDGRLPDLPEQGVETIDAIRNEIMEGLQFMTACTDNFQIYEYVLNRIEYRFNDREFPPDYTDEGFVREMMDYIIRDRALVNMKITGIVGQLPMRMTKQRYFEIVNRSFALYLGDEKGNLNDMIDMLRTCAALDEPKDASGKWKELGAVCREIRSTDYKQITAEEWEQRTRQISSAAEEIERISSLYSMLQEAVNDVYIILLAMPYVLTEAEEEENCKRIVRHMLDGMESGSAFESGETDQVKGFFEKLEGKQEYLDERISECDSLLDSMDELENEIKSMMLEKQYLSLKQITKLASNSRFIDLHKKRQTEPVDEQYLKDAFLRFTEEMEQAFKDGGRLAARARMAVTLEALPPFFKKIDECLEYMEQSLKNCSDEREKLASVELIRELME